MLLCKIGILIYISIYSKFQSFFKLNIGLYRCSLLSIYLERFSQKWCAIRLFQNSDFSPPHQEIQEVSIHRPLPGLRLSKSIPSYSSATEHPASTRPFTSTGSHLLGRAVSFSIKIWGSSYFSCQKWEGGTARWRFRWTSTRATTKPARVGDRLDSQSARRGHAAGLLCLFWK